MEKDLIRSLTRIVEVLEKCHRNFVQLAQDQKQALVRHDLEELNLINQGLDRTVRDIQELDRKRSSLLERLAELTSGPCQKLQEVADAFPCEEAEELLAAGRALKQAMGVAQSTSEVNQRLIRSSREFIRSTIAIITGYADRRQPEFSTYGSGGVAVAERRQTRMLFDRKV